MDGFFNLNELGTIKPLFMIPQCGSCKLYQKCKSPKMKVSGKGRKGILIVGDYPQEDEDKQGVQFVGKSGQFLKETMRRLGIEPLRDCWFTNALICSPENNKISSDKYIDFCRPNLINTIEELKPDIIILLGNTALKSLIEYVWKENPDSITRWAGWTIPCTEPNSWICPTYHPSYLLRNTNSPVLKLWFERHLEEFFSLKGKPWTTLPDYKSQVRVILNPSDAAREVARIVLEAPQMASFDYETDHLKPDRAEAQIVACSISIGTDTIAYPWYGEAIKATKDFLLSPIGKLGYNIKFEERWTRDKLGIRVRNWLWDGMLAAHTLDNRRHISGLKFQSFIKLGAIDYDSLVKPYLSSAEPAGKNRIREVDIESILEYCGIDSLLTYQLAQIQMKEMNYHG